MNATSKVCTGCGQDLPLDDFQRDRRGKYGRTSRCRRCNSLRQGHKHIPRSKNEGMKICTKCLREMPLEAFYKHSRGKHGVKADCKDCHRNYGVENAERISESGRLRRTLNSEQYRERDRAYYVANAERIKARVADYAKHRPDATRRHRRNHADRHPERRRVNVIRRRARLRGAEGHFSHDDISRQYEKQALRCYWCSALLEGKYHVDHVVPLARGGTNWPHNLVVACQTCNCSKGDRLPYSEWTPPNPLD